MDLLEKEEVWKKRLERERALKKEAERLLEEKSMELYHAQELLKIKLELLEKVNQDLEESHKQLAVTEEELREKMEELDTLNRNLEEKVAERTRELEAHKAYVMSSINYAQRIQQTMLPPVEEMKQWLPDLFVLFQPKEVVSGDFYWCDKVGNKIVIAVVDCTGHGVPGAFMSMIGNDLIHGIIKWREVLEPHGILTYLDYAVRTVLRQDVASVQDGMDASVCVIDLEKKTLEYAGAKNPLYLIQEGEMHILNGTKRSIGGMLSNNMDIPFLKHTVDISKPSMLYMCSDGYQDQHGWQGKKYMVKRFRELLFEIHSEPIEVQQQLLEEHLHYWKQEKKQTDDILVMGIQLTL